MVDNDLLLSVPGFRDFYPAYWKEIQFILDKMQKISRKYGYVEYEGPSLELVDLIEAKSGADLMDEIFTLTDKQNRRLLLRPEQTPTLARMLAKEQKRYKRPIRWFSIPRLFRDETAQRGRVREFWQLNVDILGVKDISADAEMITVAIDIIRACGLKDNQYNIYVNHRELLNAFIQSITDIDPPKLIPLIDKKVGFLENYVRDDLNKSGMDINKAKDQAALFRQIYNSTGNYHDKLKGAAMDETLQLFDNIESITEKVMIGKFVSAGMSDEAAYQLFGLTSIKGKSDAFFSKIESIDNPAIKDAIEDLKKLSTYLEGFGALEPVVFDTSLARGLDYYTGVVFEAFDVSGQVVRAICGGGRYSDLVEAMGGEPLTGSGFGMGETVLLELVKLHNQLDIEEEQVELYLAPIKETSIPSILGLSTRLRSTFNLQSNPFNWRVKRHLEYADHINANLVLLQGPKDIENNAVSVRKVSSGEQVQLIIDEKLEENLLKLLKN